MSRMISRLLLVSMLLVFLSACGPSVQSDRPATHPVSGTVTMNGQAVPKATLSFQLADGSGSAAGVTASQGRYELTTFTPGDGAVPGEYLVAITQFEEPPPGAGVADDHPDCNPNLPEFVPTNLLPERYATAGASELKATVVEGPNTGVDFELTD